MHVTYQGASQDYIFMVPDLKKLRVQRGSSWKEVWQTEKNTLKSTEPRPLSGMDFQAERCQKSWTEKMMMKPSAEDVKEYF